MQSGFCSAVLTLSFLPVFFSLGGELQNVVDSLLSEGLAEARKTGPQSE